MPEEDEFVFEGEERKSLEKIEELMLDDALGFILLGALDWGLVGVV